MGQRPPQSYLDSIIGSKALSDRYVAEQEKRLNFPSLTILAKQRRRRERRIGLALLIGSSLTLMIVCIWAWVHFN